MIVGILGGTFDPPHLGHLEAAEISLRSKLADEVWLVPCFAHRFGKAPAPFEHRVAMAKLLIAGHPRLKVSTIEAELGRPGHTLDLILLLMERYPKHGFRLVAGADVYHERDKWHRFDEIARLAPPIYLARHGCPPIPEPVLEAPPDISSSALRDLLCRGERPENETKGAVLDYIEANGLYGCA